MNATTEYGIYTFVNVTTNEVIERCCVHSQEAAQELFDCLHPYTLPGSVMIYFESK